MIEELFMKLVSIDSPSGEESDFGKFVKDELDKLGFDSLIDIHGNILARCLAQGEPFLISAHLDTVQGKSKVRPVRVNGHIESSGDTILGADNKATIAAVLTALMAVPVRKRRNLEIVFSVREETDGGVSGIDMTWLKSKRGVVADTAEPIGSIITDTPFIDGFTVEVTGERSHSSEPENGINALSIASRAISKFGWGKVDEISTANIGLIRGGSAVNVTPGKVLLEGEIRSYDRKNLSVIKKRLGKTFRIAAEDFGGQAFIEFKPYCNGYSLSKSSPMIRELKNVYGRLNIEKSFIRSLGGSDANFFNSVGIEVVDIGDGVNNPHTNYEFISVKDLNRLTDIFHRLIRA